MDTKNQILEASRLLFNNNGVMNVTLRDVSKFMNRSYGNITYHFPTKEEVISRLFETMNDELNPLRLGPSAENPLIYIFELPSYSYDITLKYLFFTIDYNELKRNHPALFKKVELLNGERKKKWMELLVHLREGGSLNEHLSNEDLAYILFLSISVRSAYFQMQELKTYNKEEYIKIVNQMLKPYLSSQGLFEYGNWLKSQ